MSERHPWDASVWKERDTGWAAGCRWLQSWWRENRLNLDPGEHSEGRPDRLVSSMLPIAAERDRNFLNREILAAVDARIDEGNHSGIIEKDRLFRNLLSSQPACFNLFGPFVTDPSLLLDWVKSIDVETVSVDLVRFEWAPNRKNHFDGGSAFDAVIEYSASGRRFLAIECKYAENLATSSINVRDPYRTFTENSDHWRTGATRRLDVTHLRQFWLNVLLAQSLVERENVYERGIVLIVACASDSSARTATGLVRSELHEPDRWLRWMPYESILEHAPSQGLWAEHFRSRYLNFTPVAHMLADDDERISRPEPPDLGGLDELNTIGQ